MSAYSIEMPQQAWQQLVKAVEGGGFWTTLSSEAGVVLFSALLGFIFGLLGNYLISSWQEMSLRERHRAAVKAEIDFAHKASAKLVQDWKEKLGKEKNGVTIRIWDFVPAARLSTIAYTSALPGLLSAGALCPHALKAVLEYYAVIEAYNRIADLLHQSDKENEKQPIQVKLDEDGAVLKKLDELVAIAGSKSFESALFRTFLLKVSHLSDIKWPDKENQESYYKNATRALGGNC